MELKTQNIDQLKKELKGGGYKFENESESKLEFQRTTLFLSTFDRIGLKECEISNSSFTQCVFVNCYGRKATFTNVDFTGSTFINCNFRGAAFKSCTFKYCTFQNSDIPVPEIQNCLPNEYNLRNDLCRNLKVNFSSIGDKTASDTFLILELEALRKEHFAIFWGETEYYKSKYNVIDRFKSFWEWVKIHLSRFFYGHGINVWMLLVSFLVVSSILSFIISHWDAQFLKHDDIFKTNEVVSPNFFTSWVTVFGEAIKYSFIDLKPIGSLGRVIIHISRLLGLFYLGLITATIYRRIAR